MTDPTALPPEQEAVRRLLADARHDGPTPPEVVARLDATLAELAAERGEATPAEPTRAPVVALLLALAIIEVLARPAPRNEAVSTPT